MFFKPSISFQLICGLGSAYHVISNPTFREFQPTEPQDVISMMPYILRRAKSCGVLRSSSSYSLAADRAIASGGTIESLLLSITRMLIAPSTYCRFFFRATSDICWYALLPSIRVVSPTRSEEHTSEL